MYEQVFYCMNGQFQIGQLTPWRYFLGVAIAIGLILGFTTQPQGTVFSWLHLLSWQLQSNTAIWLLVLIQMTLAKLRRYQKMGPWFQLILSGLLASLFITPVYLALDIVNGLNTLPGSSIEWSASLADEFIGFLPPVLVTWLAINAPFCLGYRLVDNSKLQAALKAQDESAPLATGASGEKTDIEADLRSTNVSFSETLTEEILYIKAELHYIKVVTSVGSDLVLYNLKDAVRELPEHLGTLCHRSYWVNFLAIESFKKNGRQGYLLLRNGEKIPVSRQHVERFRQDTKR